MAGFAPGHRGPLGVTVPLNVAMGRRTGTAIAMIFANMAT